MSAASRLEEALCAKLGNENRPMVKSVLERRKKMWTNACRKNHWPVPLMSHNTSLREEYYRLSEETDDAMEKLATIRANARDTFRSIYTKRLQHQLDTMTEKLNNMRSFIADLQCQPVSLPSHSISTQETIESPCVNDEEQAYDHQSVTQEDTQNEQHQINCTAAETMDYTEPTEVTTRLTFEDENVPVKDSEETLSKSMKEMFPCGHGYQSKFITKYTF